MPQDDQDNPAESVCSFCGKTAMDVRRGMITSRTGPGRICDECLKLIGEMQWEEIVDEVTEAQNADSSAAARLAKPQIVTRYVSADVQPLAWNEEGVDWICDGCGWRLRLSSGAEPPREHSHEIFLGSWLEFSSAIPPRKFVSLCTARWRRKS